ncbi:MAG: RNA-binding protein [Pirellulaceae bacterium]|nr:MAG: RNA-binding protein [Pirellulaceae bacterium]
MTFQKRQMNRHYIAVISRSALVAATGVMLILWVTILRQAAWQDRGGNNPSTSASFALLDNAKRAFLEGRYSDAEELARQLHGRSGAAADALLLAAEAALRDGRRDGALRYLKQLDKVSSAASAPLLATAGDLAWRIGGVRQAETLFRRALSVDPHQLPALHRLAFILTVEGRRWETEPLLFELLKQGDITLEELILLGDLWPDYNLPSETRRYLEAVPDDPLPRLAAARDALHRFQLEQARQWLEQILAYDRNLVEAHAWLGWIIAQHGFGSEYQQWESRLPPGADVHPQIWYARGLAAKNSGQVRAAIRCFWEAARRDPNHEQIHYQLSVLLAGEGEQSLAEPFRTRAEQLFQLAAGLKHIYNHRHQLAVRSDTEQTIRQVVELCEQLGRLWEARQWCRVLLSIRPTSVWAVDKRRQLDRQLTAATPRTSPTACPALSVDLSSYPLPFALSEQSDGRERLPLPAELPPVRFVDRAGDSGLLFTAYNGDDPAVEEVRLLESTGNGTGVLDFDGDGWPDLLLTQACPWPPDERQIQYRSRLFRNQGGKTFRDITEESGLHDVGFSQGIAVGDFNNDGFPDVLVAKVGPNRLYRNNGDGTFQLAWEEITGTIWTTSCAIADVNGDSWPDLYEVNYLAGDVFERRCFEGGRPRTCPPALFPAAQDRLLLNQGNGLFDDITAEAGIMAPGGKGLGILVADFDHSGKLSVFVANDGTPNFYFVNQAERGASPRFQNRAFLTGLACDRLGQFQACMGIAAGDVDQDGNLDLFVTNFYDEMNALYMNHGQATVFEDEALQRGLGTASLKMLGFGTQFVDSDLDGWPDLLVTNGHIEDRSRWGQPFKMPAQYFHNLGGGRFVEVPAQRLGDFFQRTFLGRGMARLDWNGDGREDVVISHMNDPVALLTNESPVAANVLVVELRGTISDRDAVGAIVQVHAAGRLRTAQVTAGDGYMASNQKQLVFGLGKAEVVDQLSVRWPSGIKQQWAAPPINCRLILIEGHSDWVSLPLAGSKAVRTPAERN